MKHDIEDLKARRGTGTAYEQLCRERIIANIFEAKLKEIKDDLPKVWECIGLLNSMVRSGESHSDTSCRTTVRALDTLERIERNT